MRMRIPTKAYPRSANSAKMPFRIMLLHIGEKDEANADLIRQMRNGSSAASYGTSDTPIPGTDLLVNISNATLKIEDGGRPRLLAKPGCGAGAILIYDTTRRKSYAACMGWIDAFRDYAPSEATVLLLANRSHESGTRKRAVSKEEGMKFADNVNALYCEANRHYPNTAKKALVNIVMNIHEKLKSGSLGTGPSQGVVPITSRRFSTNSTSPTVPSRPLLSGITDHHERGIEDDMKVPELESKVSYLEKELERTQKTLQTGISAQESLKQHEQQLIWDNSILRQDLDSAKREAEDLRCEKAAIQQEKSWLVKQLESKENEVGQLSDQITALKQMCASLQQERARSSALQQQNIQLNEALQAKTMESVIEQQRLQREISLKEEAFQNESRRLAKANATIHERELALSQARTNNRIQRMPEVDEHWKVSREEVQIRGPLGHGAWGYVVQGQFRGMTVAVKYMHEAITNHRNLERVRREIRTMASVRHPNVVLFIAAVLDEGPPIIISELLDIDLRTAYEGQQLKYLHAKIYILHGVACALNYLHKLREPIIHRDISAPNVLLKASGDGKWTPKVSDFGSANLAQNSKTLGEGAIIYAAPETYPNSTFVHTTKIDVYSYGVLVGELITEKLPNPESHHTGTLRELGAQSPDFHRLMADCIKQNPRERPAMDSVITEYLDTMLAAPSN